MPNKNFSAIIRLTISQSSRIKHPQFRNQPNAAPIGRLTNPCNKLTIGQYM